MAGKEQLNLELGTSSCTVAVLSMGPRVLRHRPQRPSFSGSCFLSARPGTPLGLSEAHITDFLGLRGQDNVPEDQHALSLSGQGTRGT